MRIALVHDYLNEAGGAERVLRVLAEMYPEAPIYTAYVKNGTAKKMFEDREVRESKWGWLLKRGRTYSYLRFALPWIWRSIDLSNYDLVITSCSGYIARGFGTGKKTTVVAYCHTPPRWLYGYETPTGAGTKWWGKIFMAVVGPWVRFFDYKAAGEVDIWIANSQEVARRIEKYYRKKATVVYPPVKVQGKKLKVKRADYYLVVARLTGAKGIEEAIRGALKADVKLKIVGEDLGKKYKNKRRVHGEQIEFLGRVNDEELAKLYAGAKGFIALAKDEDFGMTVVEAMAHGTPVLAYRGGGYKETVREKNQEGLQTGVFVESTEPESVAEGIRKMEIITWDREAIEKQAGKFGRARFEKEMRRIISARAT